MSLQSEFACLRAWTRRDSWAASKHAYIFKSMYIYMCIYTCIQAVLTPKSTEHPRGKLKDWFVEEKYLPSPKFNSSPLKIYHPNRKGLSSTHQFSRATGYVKLRQGGIVFGVSYRPSESGASLSSIARAAEGKEFSWSLLMLVSEWRDTRRMVYFKPCKRHLIWVFWIIG